MSLLKIFYVILGFISLGLGLIGIILPILPTTPFLLLTAFCFVKGSDKFDKWFKGTRIYKNHLTKLTILLTADIMLLFPLILSKSIHLKIFIVILMMFKFYYFIFRIKTVKVGEVVEQNR